MTRKTPWLLALTLVLTTAPGARAQDEEEETGWSSRAEVSIVATGGNTESQTISLRGTATRSWGRAELTMETGGLQAEDTTKTRTAFGQQGGGFVVQETSTTQKTAENYFLRGQFRRELTERVFWFAGAGWARNEFNGIRNRYSGEGGVGNVWFDTDDALLRTDYGLSVTREEPVVVGPGSDEETFLGARLAYLYERQLTGTTGYLSELVADQNLDDTSDLRVKFLNSVSVAMSERLALKAALELFYDAEPSLESVPLLGFPSGASGVVLLPLDELDSVLTVALVVDF